MINNKIALTFFLFGFSLGTSLILAEEQSRPDFTSPVDARQSLAYLKPHPELNVELVAAEPEVVDPVAVRFDGAGRMWVVEMIDYPLGPKTPDDEPMSRIKFLTDQDGDGYYETSKIFADKLLFVTGVLPWKEGVIATLAGEVAYLADTDGDGRADSKQTWFTGFAEKNTQLRANHPTFGLDNQIYIANGLRGGEVMNVNPDWKEHHQPKPVNIRGKDFRFNPLTGEFETVAGNGQFGLTIDSNGNRFICSNRNPCMQVMLEDHYLKRNPQLIVPSLINDVSPAGPDSRLYAISQTWVTSNLHAGQFTAACGVHRYEGNALPNQFYGNSFTCDPTSNIVHRDVLTPSGATFTSRYGREKKEFLASYDEWFRPVNVTTGPDGALYVVDMYRAVIEHPQWVPDELKVRPDERYGDDKGRIYRLVPKKFNKPEIANLNQLSSKELVTYLDHPNSWQRKVAARLLYERQDNSVVEELKKLVSAGKTSNGRIRALYTLKGLGLLEVSDIITAFKDKSPRVLEQAVKLSEPFLNSEPRMNTEDDLFDILNKLAKEPDARLRFQIALSVGEIQDDCNRGFVLGSVVSADSIDDWTISAVLSSEHKIELELLIHLFTQPPKLKEKNRILQHQKLVSELALICGAEKLDDSLSSLLPIFSEGIKNDDETTKLLILKALNAFIKGYQTRGTRKSFAEIKNQIEPELQKQVDTLWTNIQKLAGTYLETPTDLSLQAVKLLAYAPTETAVPILVNLFEDSDDQSIKNLALTLLANHPGTGFTETLLEAYGTSSPRIRRAILANLISTTARTEVLLNAIAEKEIAPAELDQAQKKRLLNHNNPKIKAAAAKLLVSKVSQDRNKVIEKYKSALALKADPKKGKQVFAKICATCHKIGDVGVDVAPDISDSRVKKPIQYLTDILDPNKAVDNNYFSYTIVTTDGKTYSGIIASETSTSVVLKQPENKQVSLLRDDIEFIKADGVSLMPNGLEENLSLEQMADLISFIKNWRYLDGRIPIDVGQPASE